MKRGALSKRRVPHTSRLCRIVARSRLMIGRLNEDESVKSGTEVKKGRDRPLVWGPLSTDDGLEKIMHLNGGVRNI